MRLALLLAAFTLLTTIAQGADYFSNAAIVATYDESGKPLCPRYYVVAKKYCWNNESHWFNQCGYFCNKSAVPPKGPSGR